MLRQAGVRVNLVLRDEDLRTQLVEAAPAWEVERILACETPDQVCALRSAGMPTSVQRHVVNTFAEYATVGRLRRRYQNQPGPWYQPSTLGSIQQGTVSSLYP